MSDPQNPASANNTPERDETSAPHDDNTTPETTPINERVELDQPNSLVASTQPQGELLAIEVPLIGPPAALESASEDEEGEEDEELAEPGRPRLLLLAVAALVLVAAGAALGLLIAQWNRAPGEDQVIARVGETPITRGEFMRRWQDGADPKAVLDELIDVELVVQASTREGVQLDTTEIDQQVQRIREQYGDQETFESFLQENNIPSEEALRELLARDQMIQAMLLNHTTLEQARARHILLQGDGPEAIAARKAEAETLLKQIQDGGDFAALAAEKSDDPGSKPTGGELGWAPRGAFVSTFDEAVFSMQPGELRLVETEYGWHIIELQEAAQVRPLEDQRYFQSPAVQKAINDTFLPWIKSLRTDAEAAGQVSVLVQPADLMPSPAPAVLPPTLAPVQ